MNIAPVMCETDPYNLKPCDNRLCDRKVRQGTDFCCGPCRLASEGSYEIHEDGPLGHSDGCNERRAIRAEGHPKP